MVCVKVEVVYARPERQELVSLELDDSASVLDAIRRSGLLERFPEIDLEQQCVGIFGKLCAVGHPLQPGDRVEIYRPLISDPKDLRRARAARLR